jgi:hypothetical protein
MDDRDDAEIEYIIFNIGVFSKGCLTIKELEEMPLSRVFNYNEYANRINREIQREADRQRSK